MNEQLKDILNKLPFVPIMIAIIGYHGYEYYQFMESPESELGQAKQRVEVMNNEIASLKKRKAEVDEFAKKLDQKRAEIRDLVRRLEEMRASISETLDVAEFMKLVLVEAKRVGVNVSQLNPGTPRTTENYIEHPFTLSFRGVYVQLLVLLDRLASLQRVVRVESLQVKPVGSQSSRFVDLEGTVDLRAYRYNRSATDTIGKDGAGAAPVATDPAGRGK